MRLATGAAALFLAGAGGDAGLRVDPQPRETSGGSLLRVSGEVDPATPPLRVLVWTTEGESLVLPVRREGDCFEALVPVGELPGEAAIVVRSDAERDTDGDSDPNSPPAAAARVRVTVAFDELHGTEIEAERFLLALLNASRVRARLRPLASDPELARIARAHSAEQSHRGTIDHLSPETGSPESRIAAAGYPALESGENVGRASRLVELDQALLASPGHRANILSPRFSHAGVGIVLGRGPRGQRGEWYVTELFARKSRRFEAGDWCERVRAIVQRERLRLGRPSMIEDADLDALAERVAGEDDGERERALREALASATAPGGTGVVWGSLERLGEIEQLQIAEQLLRATFRRLGVGVRHDPNRQPPNIVVVLLAAS